MRQQLLVAAVLVCGYSTTMWLVSAQRFKPVLRTYCCCTSLTFCLQPCSATCRRQVAPLWQACGM